MKQPHYLVAAAAALVLAACTKTEEAAKPAAPAPAKTAAAPNMTPAPSPPQTYTQAPPSAAVPHSSVTVRNVMLGTSIGADRKVAEPTRSASARSPLFVSFDLYGAGEANVKVRWGIKGGGQLKEDTAKLAVTQPSTLAYPRPENLTPGEYDVEVIVNEVSMGKTPFTLQ